MKTITMQDLPSDHPIYTDFPCTESCICLPICLAKDDFQDIYWSCLELREYFAETLSARNLVYLDNFHRVFDMVIKKRRGDDIHK